MPIAPGGSQSTPYTCQRHKNATGVKHKNTKTLGFVLLGLGHVSKFQYVIIQTGPRRFLVRVPDQAVILSYVISVFRLFLKFLVFSAKSFNAAGRIDEFLFSREKRVTFRADLNTDILFGGANLQDVATCTFDVCFRILRMNVRFH